MLVSAIQKYNDEFKQFAVQAMQSEETLKKSVQKYKEKFEKEFQEKRLTEGKYI